jgi:hypothetical protein
MFGEGLLAREEPIGDRLAAIQYQVPPHWPRSSPGGPQEAWVQSTIPVSRPRDQTVISGSKSRWIIVWRAAGGYSAGGLGCLLPDVCWLTSEVASPSPVVVEPVGRELSVSARLAS